MVVFLFGIFCPLTNGTGAFASLVVGHGLGVMRLLLRLIYGDVPSNSDENVVLRTFVHSHFLHFIFFTFVCCIVVILGVSWLTRKELIGVAEEKERKDHQLVWGWSKERSNDGAAQEGGEQEQEWDAERRPLLVREGEGFFYEARAILGKYQHQVRIGLSVILIICIFTIEFIFQ